MLSVNSIVNCCQLIQLFFRPPKGVTLVNWGLFQFSFIYLLIIYLFTSLFNCSMTLNKIVGCSYLLSKCYLKILWDKKWLISFYFNFCMAVGVVEGAIALISKHNKAHFNISTIYFFHKKYCKVWRVNALVHSVKVWNQGAVYIFKCHIPQCFRNIGVFFKLK